MTLPPLERLFFSGPAGRLEGRLELPRGEQCGAAVLGHPHPLYGGTMYTNALVHTARVLAARGFATLRFSFRGTGGSEGTHSGGRGEDDDFRAALVCLRERFPQEERLVLGGMSFGAIRALRIAAETAAEGIAYLGVVPSFGYPGSRDLPRVVAPAALVIAGADELVESPLPAQLDEWFADLRTVEEVPGADHVFTGKLDQLEQAADRALGRLFDAGVGEP